MLVPLQTDFVCRVSACEAVENVRVHLTYLQQPEEYALPPFDGLARELAVVGHTLVDSVTPVHRHVVIMNEARQCHLITPLPSDCHMLNSCLRRYENAWLLCLLVSPRDAEDAGLIVTIPSGLTMLEFQCFQLRRKVLPVDVQCASVVHVFVGEVI